MDLKLLLAGMPRRPRMWHPILVSEWGRTATLPPGVRSPARKSRSCGPKFRSRKREVDISWWPAWWPCSPPECSRHSLWTRETRNGFVPVASGGAWVETRLTRNSRSSSLCPGNGCKTGPSRWRFVSRTGSPWRISFWSVCVMPPVELLPWTSWISWTASDTFFSDVLQSPSLSECARASLLAGKKEEKQKCASCK